MPRTIALKTLVGTLWLALVLTGLARAQDHDLQASPFDSLRWDGATPEVRIDSVWYRAISLDGFAVEDICAFCEERWPRKMKKRFGEDLVEALTLMGWEGDLEVDLELVRLDDGDAVNLSGVEMTKERRNAIRNSAGRAPIVAPTTTMTREQALADIDQLEVALRDQFAYLELKGLDFDGAIARLREQMEDEVSLAEFSAAVRALMMRFGDGHADVRRPPLPPDGSAQSLHLPFLLERTSAGIVAFRPERDALVDAEHPVVTKLDGRPLAEWLDALRTQVAHGSPQLVEHRALRDLRNLGRARELAGIEADVAVRVTFTDAAGRSSLERTVELSRESPTYGAWPRSEARVLAGDVGYLPIPEMNEDLAPLRGAMDRFRETEGLIVDVRGNGGGTRDILLALAGYLIGPDDPALAGNVAAYRLSTKFDEDHLEARFMHRAGWRGWSERQRAAIASLASGFEPEWSLPDGFSEWHYLVLDRTGEPAEYHYERPVVVLCNAGCFSATDIFLGALELLPNVTLVGTASSGGSARSKSFELSNSRIQVRCASMASFRPNGRLYDGRGVEVDIEVLPAPDDLLEGGGDAQLEAALGLLRAR